MLGAQYVSLMTVLWPRGPVIAFPSVSAGRRSCFGAG